MQRVLEWPILPAQLVTVRSCQCKRCTTIEKPSHHLQVHQLLWIWLQFYSQLTHATVVKTLRWYRFPSAQGNLQPVSCPWVSYGPCSKPCWSVHLRHSNICARPYISMCKERFFPRCLKGTKESSFTKFFRPMWKILSVELEVRNIVKTPVEVRCHRPPHPKPVHLSVVDALLSLLAEINESIMQKKKTKKKELKYCL